MLLNRAKAYTATAGTGTVTLGAAVAPYQSFAAAGAINGMEVSYLIEDGSAWEIGRGIFNSGGNTITRPGPGVDPAFDSSTGALIALSGTATIACVANAADYALQAAGSGSGYAYYPPKAADYVLNNTGVTSGAMIDTPTGMALAVVAAGGGDTRAITALKNAPAAPYSFMARMIPAASYDGGAGEGIAGICLADGTGALITIYRYTDGNIYVQKWGSKGVFSANIATLATPNYIYGELWLGLILDGSGNLIPCFGNGTTWIEGAPIVITTYLAAGPYFVGYHVAARTTAGDVAAARIPYADENATITPPTATITNGGGVQTQAFVALNPATGGFIDKQFNVASVTKTAGGRYRINFTTPFADTHYLVSGSGQFTPFADNNYPNVGIDRQGDQATTYCDIVITEHANTNASDTPVVLAFQQFSATTGTAA